MDMSTLLPALLQLITGQQAPPDENATIPSFAGEGTPTLSAPPSVSPPQQQDDRTPGQREARTGGLISGGMGLAGLLGAILRKREMGNWGDPEKNPLFSAAPAMADRAMERLKQEMSDKHEMDKMLLTDADKAVRELAGVDLDKLQGKVPATVLHTLQDFSKNHWGMVLSDKGGPPNSNKIKEFLSFYNSVRPTIMGAQQEHTMMEQSRIRQAAEDTARGGGLMAGGWQDAGHGLGEQPEVGLLEPPPGGPMGMDMARQIGERQRGLEDIATAPDLQTGLKPYQKVQANLSTDRFAQKKKIDDELLRLRKAALAAKRAGKAPDFDKKRIAMIAAAQSRAEILGEERTPEEIVAQVDALLSAAGATKPSMTKPSSGAGRYKTEQVIPGR